MPGYTEEITFKVAPARFFKVAIVDAHNLVSKVIPEVVSSGEIVEGNGGVGTVRLFKFTDAAPYKTLKERIGLLDVENFEFSWTILEGGVLGDKPEFSNYTLKLQPTADGGSFCKVTAEFHPKPGFELTEEEINADKEDNVDLFRAIEAYLLANPDAYV